MNRELLEQPFPSELIKTRPGSHGQDLKYVEAVEYVRRLNQVFEGNWSFDVMQHEVTQNEVIVLGKLTADGVVKMAFGGSSITRAKLTGEAVSIADDLKAAATDSLKKAASILGMGLHLYEGKKNGESATPANGNGTEPKGNGNGRLTSRQLDAILGIGKDKGFDREAIKKMALERFGKNVEFIGKAEASSLIQELQGNGNGS